MMRIISISASLSMKEGNLFPIQGALLADVKKHQEPSVSLFLFTYLNRKQKI